jgi:peroxiredoxin
MSLKHKFLRAFGREEPLTNIRPGNFAPGFSLKGVDGKQYSLATALENGTALVAFFKISCPVCQFTFPFLQRLADRYAASGVTFLAVSQDNLRHTSEFLQEYRVKFATLLDEPDYTVSNKYGLTSVPTIFLIGSDGKVLVRSEGFSKGDLETIAAALAKQRQLASAPLFGSDESVPALKPG